MDSGYRAGSSPGGPSGGQVEDAGIQYWSLERCKRAYEDYLSLKSAEIQEQIQARRYRHCVQWTASQIKVLNARKQPVVTYNRIGRKINSVIGLVEKLRQSPKGFPRTEMEDQRGGADLSTAIIKYVLDTGEWHQKSPISAAHGATDGIGGVELVLEQGDMGDPDIGFEIVEPDSFFYDPRSYNLDFSDARFMGQGKWVDTETAIELLPQSADQIQTSIELGANLTSNADREQKWFFSDGRDVRRIRLIDIWYKHKGQWCWAIFTGSAILMQGLSYFHDEKKKTFCKYFMFSANVDQDGDRYGFVRNWKAPQDEINMRRSKGLHSINSRRIIAELGAFSNIEEARIEATRPDGILSPNPGKKVEFDDTARMAETEAHLKLLEEAKLEIDSYGPNPQLSGQGITKDQSGRAIALLQQAGIAELGPFILAYRGWKIRLYRAIWNACREHWTSERVVRVTDDEKAVAFLSLNKVNVDPMSGMPIMQNMLGSLDVDIILDEGPDSVNVIQDTHDALMALAQSGGVVPPDVLIEFMPGLDSDTKKRIIQRLQQAQQPDPMDGIAKQTALEDAQAKIGVSKTTSIKNIADALSKIGSLPTAIPGLANPAAEPMGAPMGAPGTGGLPVVPPPPGGPPAPGSMPPPTNNPFGP